MSKVTNLLIIGRKAEENLENINNWIEKDCNILNAFKEISQYSGGDKHMETDILASALNYFDRTSRVLSFIDYLRGLEWSFDIELLLMTEYSDTLERTQIYKNKI